MIVISIDSPLAPIVTPLIAAVVIAILGRGSVALRQWLTVLALFANLLLAFRWISPASPVSFSSNTTALGGQLWSFTFRVDTLSGLLIVLLATSALLIAFAAATSTEQRIGSAGTVPLLLALSSANGALFAGDLFTLYAGTLMTSAFLLVFTGRNSPAPQLAAFRLFTGIEVTGLAVLLVIMFALARHAPLSLMSISSIAAVGPFVLLAIVVRVGLVPFHVPSFTALEAAARNYGAIVYPMAASLGVYLLLRLNGAMLAAGLPSSGVLLTLGTATVLVAAFALLRQRGLRQAVAALTIAQVGFVAMGVAGDRSIGTEAAIAQLLCIVLFAPLPFLALDHLLQGAEGDSDEHVRLALARRPLAGLLLAAGLLAGAGLPPSYSFLARGYVLQSLLSAGGVGNLVGALALLLANGAALTATAKIIAVSLFGAELGGAMRWWHGSRRSALSLVIAAVPLLVFAAAPFALHRWLVGPALRAALGAPASLAGVTGGTVLAGALLILAFSIGGWLFLSPSSLPSAVEERLRPVAAAIERLASDGYLDLHNLVVLLFGTIARLVAVALGKVLDRLAI